MTEIQQAVTAWLAQQTGVRTVAGRSPVREYPLLSVEVEQAGVTLVDGGRQAERRYTVTVSAAADRDREGNGALLTNLVPVLLRGIPMEGRVLHPLEVSTDGERLTFTLCLCQLIPLPEDGQGGEPGYMEHLHFTI